MSASCVHATTQAKMPIGTLMKKIQCHEYRSVIQPPSTGPTMGATMVIMPISASAMPRLALGQVAIIRLCVTGYIGPDTAPWMARKNNNMPIECENPQASEASENNIVHQTNSLY